MTAIDPALRATRTTCPYCGVGCGVLAMPDGNGGAAISGGRGTLIGSLLGVALLGTIGPALVFLGTRPQWEKAIQGAIILLAVASDALARRGRS